MDLPRRIISHRNGKQLLFHECVCALSTRLHLKGEDLGWLLLLGPHPHIKGTPPVSNRVEQYLTPKGAKSREVNDTSHIRSFHLLPHPNPER